MTQALIRRFVKQYENTQDPHVRSAYETLAGFLGILCNLVLFAAKLAAGLLTGSIAVISDAFNNLSDLGSSLVSVIGARLACEEPDEKHPLGHGRIEYIAALSVAGLILVVGLELGKSSVEKLIHPTPVQFHLLTVVLLCGSVLVKLWMFSYGAENLFAAFVCCRTRQHLGCGGNGSCYCCHGSRTVCFFSY